jgi:hypothetical protein
VIAYYNSWKLCRGRFDESVGGYNEAQLNYRLHPGTLTIGEMALHVAGVEVFFASQLLDLNLDEELTRLKNCSTEGAVNEHPFPYAGSEITSEKVQWGLAIGREHAEKLFQAVDADPGLLEKSLVSALGPVITGDGALARWGFHPGYHHGQVYVIATSPGFPA